LTSLINPKISCLRHSSFYWKIKNQENKFHSTKIFLKASFLIKLKMYKMKRSFKAIWLKKIFWKIKFWDFKIKN
jgi:hypothetical protein